MNLLPGLGIIDPSRVRFLNGSGGSILPGVKQYSPRFGEEFAVFQHDSEDISVAFHSKMGIFFFEDAA